VEIRRGYESQRVKMKTLEQRDFSPGCRIEFADLKSVYQNPVSAAQEPCRAGLPRPAAVGFRRGQASPPYTVSPRVLLQPLKAGSLWLRIGPA
jgi:hypothetical protein